MSPKHKNGIFVLFFSFVPPFSGFSSTKSAFLCAFCLRNPRFQPFQAQNQHFCAFLGFGTLVFGLFEHKISIFVLFWASEPSFSGFSSTKSAFLCFFGLRNPHFEAFRAQNWHFCAREEGDWHQGKRKLASGSITMAFLQITAHVSKTQAPHNQIINF